MEVNALMMPTLHGEAITSLILIVFVFTYIGMALGRIPGLRVDRSGIAMVAAVVLVASGATPADGIVRAIHFPTLLLMGGLMILSARVGAAGFYDASAGWIARQARRPVHLLAVTIISGGVLSALLRLQSGGRFLPKAVIEQAGYGAVWRTRIAPTTGANPAGRQT
jgi:di/tricarboxylate transporter